MKKFYSFLLCCLAGVTGYATTWYSQGTGDPSVLSNWNSSSGGGGSTPSNFTTSGDVFIMQSNMSGGSGSWTLGTGTTLQLNSVTFTVHFSNIYCYNLYITGSSYWQGYAYDYVYISGNFSLTGTSYMGNPPDWNYFYFAGPSTSSSPQTCDISTTSTGNYSYLYVSSGAYVQLISNANWSQGDPMSVNSGGTLDCAGYTWGGNQGFTVNSGGTLYVGMPGGINATLTTTGSKTLNSGGSYGFDGTSAQVTGALLPTSLTGQLIINNAAGVTLSQNTTITTTPTALTLTNGVLNTGSYSLTVPGVSTGVSGAGSSSYVAGTLIKTITGYTSVNYEVGDADYAPMQLALSAAGTAGSLGVKVTAGLHPSATSSGFGTSNMVNHYWTISNQSAAGPTTVTPTATYNLSDILGGSNNSFYTQEFTGGAWLPTALASTNTSAPYTTTPSSGINLSSLAGDYIFGAEVPYTYAVPSSLSYGIVGTGTSSVLSTNLAGGNLVAGPLTVTAPANFQVSANPTGPWTTSISVSYTPPALGATPIYIQFNPTATTTYTGNVTVTGGGLASPYNIAVTGIGQPPCSGTPSAGSASAYPTSGNGGTLFTLSLTGSTAAAGLTYQWQSSPDNITWTNIFGATTSTYSFTGLTGNTYFQCIVSCGSFPATSSSTLITSSGVAASSCTPSSYFYSCTYYVGTSGNPVIINGVSGSISDASPCGSGTGGSSYYYNNTSMSVTFLQGGSYSSTIGSGRYYTSGQIWIDFNDDGIFQQSETVGGYQKAQCCSTSPRISPTITIPSNATPGVHRMRVISGESLYYAPGYSSSYPAYPQMNPCPNTTSTQYYMDTRDYTAVINVAPASLSTSLSSLSFGKVTTGGSANPPGFITISGANLFGTPLTVTPPANFAVSLDGATWSTSPITVGYTPGYPVGSLSPTNIYVQFYPSASTSYSGNISFSGAGLSSSVLVPVSGTGVSACSGTPSAGSTVISPTSGNGATVFSLSLSGASATGGLIYQWQSSPDGTTWSNMQGGVYPTYSFSGLSANMQYRCIVTCVSSGLSATSVTTNANFTGGVATSSCVPKSLFNPCTYYVGTTGKPVMISGELGTSISDASACGSGTGGSSQYYNNTGSSVTLFQGGTYSTTIGSGYYYTSGQIWIDFNDDGAFATSETVGGYNQPVCCVIGARATPSITIPLTATPGPHRMRVMNGYSSFYAPGYSTSYPTYPQMNPCPTTSVYYADTRDYTAVIALPACSGTPNAGIVSVAGSTIGCNPYVTNLINVGENLYSGATYQWQSSTNPLSGFADIAGATNSVYAPTISTVGTVYFRQKVTCAMSGQSSTSLPTQGFILNPLPAPISGPSAICYGDVTTLSSDSTGGVWSSSNTAVAAIGTSSGVVTSVSVGNTTITYTLPVTGCFVTDAFTVNPLPSAISGATSVCQGYTTTLSDVGGGTWSSSDVSTATVGSASGIVAGVAGGTPTITYMLSTGCIATSTMTVNATAPITGTLSLCTGYGTTLSDAIGGGTWTSSNPAVASIGSLSGAVTSYAAGVTNISYINLAGCVVSQPMVVTNTPTTYSISGGGSVCPGSGAHIYVNGSDYGVGYQLLRNGTAVGSTIIAVGGTLDMGLQTVAGTYTVVANPGSPCAVTMSGSLMITILPAPPAFNVTGGGTYCSGGTGVHVGLDGSTSGYLYQLYNGSSTVGYALTGTSTILDFGPLTTAGTYTVTATNNVTGCTSGMNGNAVITVTPPPVAYSLTGGGGYCTGGGGVNVGLSNSESGVDYQLYNGGIATGSVVAGVGGPISFGLQTAAGSYTVVGTSSITGCSGNMLGSKAVTVNALPAVVSVTGGGAYCSGGSGVHVGLSTSSSGTSYAVYADGVATGVTVAGTGSPLDLGTFTTSGVYTVVATNVATGCTNNMGGSATVSITPLPTAYGLTGGGAYCQGGGGVHVGLSGSDVGVSYYLYLGGSVVGGGSGTSAPVDFGLETAPGTYTVLATNTATGCSADMPGSVLVVMNESPTAFNLTGGGSFCAGGTGVSVGLDNSDPNATYKLYANGVYEGASLVGTGVALSFGSFTDAGIYTVVASDNTTACQNNMSGTANVIVNPLPVIHNVTGGGGYCAGGTGVDIGLNGSEPGISYQLQTGGVSSGMAVSGTGSVLDFGLRTAAGAYTVAATNTSTGCTNVMAGSPAVVLNPLPVVYAVSGGGSYCAGGSGLAVTLANSDAGINYQLYRSGVAIGSPVAGVGGVLSFGSQTTAGTYSVVASDASTACANNMSGSATIAITPAPAAFAVTGGGSYCAGGSGVHIGLDNSAGGVTYQLYNGATSVGSSVSGSGVAIDFGSQTIVGSYTVIATSTATGCSGNMTGSANVSINPLPAAFSVTGGGSYCSGTVGVHAGLASSVVGISYQLYNGSGAMGASLSGTGSALDFGLQTIPGSYTVTGTNNSTGCVSTMTGSTNVAINALPAMHSVTGGGNYCVGGTGVNVGLSTGDAGISYQLYLGTSAVGGPLTGAGAALDFGPQTAAGTYTVQATNSTTGCVSNMTGSTAVTVSATPIVYSVTGGGSYCPSGSGVSIGLSGSDPGMSYQLYNGSAVGAPVIGTGAAISFGPTMTSGSYTVIAHGSTPTCVATMSGAATVSAGSVPVAHNVTGGGSFCSGGTGVSVGLDVADAGVNYQLYQGSTAMGAPVVGAGTALSFGMLPTAGTYSVKATDATSGCTNDMTGTAAVAVNALPAAFTLAGGTYCDGGPGANVVLGGSEFGVNYQLYNGSTVVGLPASGTGGVVNFGIQPAGVYTVVATNLSSTCTNGMTGSATVAAIPLPASYSMTGGGGYCAGGTGVDVQLSGSASGISYQLYNGTTAVGSPVTGTGAAIDFGLTTTGGTYTVTANDPASGCNNLMTGSANVSVNPLPVVYLMSGSSSSYCAGGTGVTVTLAGSDAGVNYQVYRDGIAVGGLFAGTGTALSFGAQTIAGHYTASAVNSSTGCSSAMSGGAIVAVNPLPAVYAVGGGGSYCGGGAGVHVSLSGSSAGIQYQLYQGATAIGAPVTGTGMSVDFGLLTAAGNYTVAAMDPASGCSSNMTGSATIGINPAPAAFTIVGGGSYCAGGTGVPVGISGSATGIQYQLHLGSSLVGTPLTGTGAALSFGNQALAGSYTVEAKNSLTGCTATMTGSATVVTAPLPAAYAVTGGGSYCSGGSGLHVGLHSSDSGVSYQLYRGGSADGSAVIGTGSALDFGLKTSSGTYTIVANDGTSGCTNNMSGSALISVNALPATYTVTGGGSYCAGGAGVHVGLSGSTSGVSYTLTSGGSVATLTGTGAALDFGLQTTAGSYTVVATVPSTGCSNNMTGAATVATSTAIVPAVSISSPGGSTGCTGRASHFTALGSGGGTAPHYEWAVNGTVAGTAGTFSYIPLAGDVVTVKMTSNAPCASPVVANAAVTMAVNPMEMPGVVLSSDHGSDVCQGTNVTFTAVPAFAGATPTYTWLKNGVVDNSSVTETYSYAPSNGDVVSCVLNSSYYCRLSDTAVSSMHMVVDVPQTPTVVVTTGTGASVLAGAQVTFTASVSNTSASPSYQWYVNGTAVAGATLPVFTGSSFSDGDVITCKATTTGVCSGVVGSGSLTLHVYGVGVPQVHASSDNIALSPNPNKGVFTIRGSLGISTDADVNIEITDMLGQVVYTSKVIARGGDLNEEIHLSSSLANGMYILNLRTDTGNRVFHIAVEQ